MCSPPRHLVVRHTLEELMSTAVDGIILWDAKVGLGLGPALAALRCSGVLDLGVQSVHLTRGLMLQHDMDQTDG